MSTSRHKGMGRRDFLKTSTCALATAAVGPKLFAGVVWQPKLVVAGFAPLEIESAGTDVFGSNVVAAERIPSADRAFLRHGATVSIQGISGAAGSKTRAVDFLTHYTFVDGGEERTVPVVAWAGGGGRARFHVPVDEQLKLSFSVTAKMPVAKTGAEVSRRFSLLRSEAKALEPRALPVELSLLRDGAIKLQRGYYVIVPVYENQSAPRWSAYSLRKSAGTWSLHERGLGEPTPAAFEHFVVRVDYAQTKDQTA